MAPIFAVVAMMLISPYPSTPIKAGEVYGCLIQGVSDAPTVDAKVVHELKESATPGQYLLLFKSTNWKGAYASKPYNSRMDAMKACDQWIKQVNKEIKSRKAVK